MLKKWKFIVFGIFILLLLSAYIYGLLIHKPGDRDFSLSRFVNVTAIHITPPEGESIYLEKDDEKWRVDNNYFANEFAVHDLKRTLRNCAVRQPVPINQRSEINKDLDNNGVMVDVFVDAYLFNFFDLFGLFNIQRRNKSIIVGRNATGLAGTYMRISGSDEPYIVYLPGFSQGIAGAFTPKKHIWFDPEIIDLSPGQLNRVKILNNEEPDESFILRIKDDFDFSFYDSDNNPIGQNFNPDSVKVMRYLSSFKNLYYESLLDSTEYKKSEKLIFPEYAFKVEVADNYQNTYSFTVFRRYVERGLNGSAKSKNAYDPDRFYIELENRQRAIAQYYVFGRILRRLSFFDATADN